MRHLLLKKNITELLHQKLIAFSVTGEMIVEFSEEFIQDKDKEGNL